MVTNTYTIPALDLRDSPILAVDVAHFWCFANRFCNSMDMNMAYVAAKAASDYVNACSISDNRKVLNNGVAKDDNAALDAFDTFVANSFASVSEYINTVAVSYHRHALVANYLNSLEFYSVTAAAYYIAKKYGYEYPLTIDNIRRAAALVHEEGTTPSDLVATLLG